MTWLERRECFDGGVLPLSLFSVLVAKAAGLLSPGWRLRLSQRGNPEVKKMRRCVLCERIKSESDLIGRLCDRCDPIQGDVLMDLQAESNGV
jgi:hypothetical protein